MQAVEIGCFGMQRRYDQNVGGNACEGVQMRLVPAFVAAAVFLSLNLSTQLHAQIPINHITDAPFTATWTETGHFGGKIKTETKQLARSSNGSTYMAEAFNGRIFRIYIDDIPNSRSVTLFPSPPSYTYILSPAPEGRFRTWSIENNRETLQRMQEMYLQKPDTEEPNGKYHRVVLGIKQEDGLTLFGHTYEFTSDTGDKRTTEVWDSDLGVAMSVKTDSPASEHYSLAALTDLRRVEPNPKLFEIPAEYLPHPDALLDAKTVFIDNRTGNREVEDGAKEAFDGWKRMAVTNSRERADLIAVFTNTEAHEQVPPPAPIEMKIYRPGSEEPLFTSHLISNRNTAFRSVSSHDEKVTAKNCVASLENRVENTHIGLATAPRAVK
jgi:hypothetical protein